MQPLVIRFYGQKELDLAYVKFPDSGYTYEALEKASILIDAFNKTEEQNEYIRLIRALESLGGGIEKHSIQRLFIFNPDISRDTIFEEPKSSDYILEINRLVINSLSMYGYEASINTRQNVYMDFEIDFYKDITLIPNEYKDHCDVKEIDANIRIMSIDDMKHILNAMDRETKLYKYNNEYYRVTTR